MKDSILLALALALCGCGHQSTGKARKMDTISNEHYMVFSGYVYSVTHADLKRSYVHDERMCEITPGTICYKHKHYGKSESNR